MTIFCGAFLYFTLGFGNETFLKNSLLLLFYFYRKTEGQGRSSKRKGNLEEKENGFEGLLSIQM